jgi:hypothetical protein
MRAQRVVGRASPVGRAGLQAWPRAVPAADRCSPPSLLAKLGGRLDGRRRHLPFADVGRLRGEAEAQASRSARARAARGSTGVTSGACARSALPSASSGWRLRSEPRGSPSVLRCGARRGRRWCARSAARGWPAPSVRAAAGRPTVVTRAGCARAVRASGAPAPRLGARSVSDMSLTAATYEPEPKERRGCRGFA